MHGSLLELEPRDYPCDFVGELECEAAVIWDLCNLRAIVEHTLLGAAVAHRERVGRIVMDGRMLCVVCTQWMNGQMSSSRKRRTRRVT